MIIFTKSAATHYCEYVPQIIPIHSSLRKFLDANKRIFRLREGDTLFEEYKKLSLENVELNIFYALSHYRRILDGILVSGIPWAHITAYYGSFFTASAILGMFGCAIGQKYVIQVNQHTPGNQLLSSKKIGTSLGCEITPHGGSHQRFWDIFYKSVYPLGPDFSPNLASALIPVSNNNLWLIETRNNINYDTKEAFNLSVNFFQSPPTSIFPSNLSGKFATQYNIFEKLLEIMFYYVKNFNIKTNILSVFGNKSLSSILRQMIYTSTPNLISKTKKNVFLTQ